MTHLEIGAFSLTVKRTYQKVLKVDVNLLGLMSSFSSPSLHFLSFCSKMWRGLQTLRNFTSTSGCPQAPAAAAAAATKCECL